jgi:CheY-like chemotaxis protein
MDMAPLNLLLADDDVDDCYLFKEALDGIPLSTRIAVVHDGVHLMQLLAKSDTILPDVLFLDLNMPRKNGFDCLTEIKSNETLAGIAIVIYSTSLDPVVADLLYQKGALYYIRKPGEFSKIREVIHRVLTLITQSGNTQPVKNKFVLNGPQ